MNDLQQMKRNIIFLISFVFVALSCESTLTAEKIIENSIEKAHGGKANWELPSVLVYEKTTTLYDSVGTVESHLKKTFRNTLKPQFTSEIIWEEDSIQKRIFFNGKETQLFHNEVPQTATEVVQKAYKEVIASQYVLWQPYKLLDAEASLKLEDKIRLKDGSEAYRVKVTYPNSDTIWWYDFDAKTWLLRQNLVKHGATYSQIENIKHEENTGLYLNQKRKSYTIDSLHNQTYLRASYEYNILELQ